MICHVVYSFAVIVAQVSVDSFFHQAQVFKNLPSFSTQFVLLEMCKGFKQNTQTYWNWESSCFTEEWGHIQVDSGRIWRFFQLNIFIIKIVKVAAIYTWILSEFEDSFSSRLRWIAILNKHKIRFDKSEGSPEMWPDSFIPIFRIASFLFPFLIYQLSKRSRGFVYF